MKINSIKSQFGAKSYILVSTLLVSTLLFGFLVQKVGATFESEVVGDGAVAHWSFEEASDDVIDPIGTVNGTVQGFPVRQQVAQQGYGYDFTTSLSQGVNLPDGAFNTHSEGAIEAIVKIDSASGDHIIFGQGDSATTGGYQVILSARDGRARLHVRPTTGAPSSITGNTALSTTEYYHIVAQMGPSGMQLFVNGVEDTPYATSGDMGVRTWFSDHAALTETARYSIGYLNRGGPTGYFDGIIDEVAIYDAPKSQAVWASHYAAAFGAPEPEPAGDIAITSPAQYRIYQRDTSDMADIEVSGTYTGTPTAIEYQVNTGGWSVLDESLSGGVFSGIIPDVFAGQHVISVRYANDTSTTASVSNIRVGDVFGWIGQSNQDGRFGNPQPYTGAGASVFDRSGSWLNLTSGYQSPAATGYSVMPRVASHIEAHTGVPVGFVAETQGRTGLISPDADWVPGGNNYDNFMGAVVGSGVNGMKAFLWYQGGREISNSISQAAYEAAEQGLLSNLRADTGFSTTPLISANKSMQADKITADIDAIRMAKIANWDNASGIYAGPTGHDQVLADGAHWSSDAQGTTLAGRWWRAIGNALYEVSESARGPRFSSATYSNSLLTVYFTGGVGSLQNQSNTIGWQVTDGNGARTVQSSTGTSSSMTLTLDQALVAPVTVTFGSGNTASGTTLSDSGTYPAPPEPFISRSATSSEADTTAPTVDSFTIPATGSSLTLTGITFTASDNTSVTGYMLTESATAPAAGDAGWSVSAPTEYTFATYGSKTLYAWAKDAAGNVSTSMSDTTVLTAPVVSTYTIGGTTTGLTGTVVLQNNGSNNLSVNSGTFSFGTALNSGATYAVTVLTQPAGQTCTVSNGSGMVASANVTNVAVTCSNDPVVNTDTVDLGTIPSGDNNAPADAIRNAVLSVSSASCYTLDPSSIETLGLAGVILPVQNVTLLGGLGFRITCSASGGTANMELVLDAHYADTAMLRAYKQLDATPGAALTNITSQITFTTRSVSGVDKTVLSYAITDGGLLDEDGIVDGNIVDPIYIGEVLAATTATTGSTGSDSLAQTGTNMISIIIFSLLSISSTGLTLRYYAKR